MGYVRKALTQYRCRFCFAVLLRLLREPLAAARCVVELAEALTALYRCGC